jgi:hypothetical protein
MRVFNEESIFISLEKCFCAVLLQICRQGYFDCTCALAHPSLYAGIVYENYCLCQCWPCAWRSFKKSMYTMCSGIILLLTQAAWRGADRGCRPCILAGLS